MILATLVAATVHAWASRAWPRRTVGALLVAVAGLLLVGARDRSVPRSRSQYLRPEFSQMTQYLRAHARPGDRAVSNWGSMGHMRYLTGIPHDSEGVMPYEIHRLIRQNARSLARTRAFLDRPNRKFLEDTRRRYVVITCGRRPPGAPFSLADLKQISRLGRLALRNRHFALFDMECP